MKMLTIIFIVCSANIVNGLICWEGEIEWNLWDGSGNKLTDNLLIDEFKQVECPFGSIDCYSYRCSFGFVSKVVDKGCMVPEYACVKNHTAGPKPNGTVNASKLFHECDRNGTDHFCQFLCNTDLCNGEWANVSISDELTTTTTTTTPESSPSSSTSSTNGDVGLCMNNKVLMMVPTAVLGFLIIFFM